MSLSGAFTLWFRRPNHSRINFPFALGNPNSLVKLINTLKKEASVGLSKERDMRAQLSIPNALRTALGFSRKGESLAVLAVILRTVKRRQNILHAKCFCPDWPVEMGSLTSIKRNLSTSARMVTAAISAGSKTRAMRGIRAEFNNLRRMNIKARHFGLFSTLYQAVNR